MYDCMNKTCQNSLTRSRFNGLAVVMAFFFLCGYATVLNSILIPYLQTFLSLSYTSVNSIPLCFYLAYFISSPIAGEYFKNHSYLAAMRYGMALAILACLCFIAAEALAYPFFFILISIFLLGTSIALIQVSGNPYVLQLAGKEKGASWMSLAHATTSFGMILAPIISSPILLSSLNSSNDTLPLLWIYSSMAIFCALCLAAARIFTIYSPKPDPKLSAGRYLDVLKDGNVLAGMLAIACSVGIEVSCSSFIVEFLASEDILSTTLVFAGILSTLFWIIFTIGRALASVALRSMSEQLLLALLCFMGLIFCSVLLASKGTLAAGALILLGLSTSALYPIIFTLTLNRTRHNASTVSGLLCMANIGGALFPIIQGLIADRHGIQFSYITPLAGYLSIILYLFYISKKELQPSHK